MLDQSFCGPQMAPDALLQPQTCTLCEREFPDGLSYNFHMKSCHISSDPNLPFKCDICAKCFSLPARLTRHYRSHTGNKPFTCPSCPKSFTVKENLSVHLRVHTQERPYTCSVCSRSFEHSGKLHRHMRIHTGERPHQCNVCSKTFIQSGQLVIHMRTHTGEKPYVCGTCGKGFTCSKQLKVHIRTHTGEKPYSCDICGKSFGYNHVLKLHQVAHYGEKVYKCTICKMTFANKKKLESHIRSHENNMMDVDRRPDSVGSDKENYIYSLPPPPPLAHIQMSSIESRTHFDNQFILPSINTICPDEVGDLSLNSSQNSRHSIGSLNIGSIKIEPVAPIRRSPVFPVTPSLIKNLLEEDFARFGPPSPLPTPPLSPEIYAKCMVTSVPSPTISTPPSLPLSPPSPAASPTGSINSMPERSLPFRKRMLTYNSESLDFSSPASSPKLAPSPAPSPTPRTSVIQFASVPTC